VCDASGHRTPIAWRGAFTTEFAYCDGVYAPNKHPRSSHVRINCGLTFEKPDVSIRFLVSRVITYDDSVMSKFTGVSRRTLNDRLGTPFSQRRSGRSGSPGRVLHSMFWLCNGRDGPGCSAHAEATYRPTPPNLTAQEEEFFDNTPRPENGWTLAACPQHRHAFADHQEEPD